MGESPPNRLLALLLWPLRFGLAVFGQLMDGVLRALFGAAPPEDEANPEE